MEFNTLEMIGLAFMSGLKIAEMAEEVKEDDEKIDETTENTTEDTDKNNTTEEADIKTGVIKLEGKNAKEFIKFIEKLTGEDKE